MVDPVQRSFIDERWKTRVQRPGVDFYPVKGRKISRLRLLFGYLYDARLFHSSYLRNTDLSVLQHRIRVVIFRKISPGRLNDHELKLYIVYYVTLSAIVYHHLLLFVFTNCLYVIQSYNYNYNVYTQKNTKENCNVSTNLREPYLSILYCRLFVSVKIYLISIKFIQFLFHYNTRQMNSIKVYTFSMKIKNK